MAFPVFLGLTLYEQSFLDYLFFCQICSLDLQLTGLSSLEEWVDRVLAQLHCF